jgi:predicted nucleic acid-binding protein
VKRCFIDTNVVIYANDRREKAKQDLAVGLVSRLIRERNGVISTQVLQEYANVALAKLGQEADIVLRQLWLLESLRLIVPYPHLVRRSIEIHQTYGTSFWDAGIIAAAEEGGCDLVLSEDLNEGQSYAGLRVLNPFSPGFDQDALFR